jgi:hypothetical protein
MKPKELKVTKGVKLTSSSRQGIRVDDEVDDDVDEEEEDDVDAMVDDEDVVGSIGGFKLTSEAMESMMVTEEDFISATKVIGI